MKGELISQYNEEIDKLKRELLASREKNGVYLPADIYEDMQRKDANQKDEIREMNVKIQSQTDDITRLSELYDTIKQSYGKRSLSLLFALTGANSPLVKDETTEKLCATENLLRATSDRLLHAEAERDEIKYLLDEHVGVETRLFKQASDTVELYKQSELEQVSLQDKLESLRRLLDANRVAIERYSRTSVDKMDAASEQESETHDTHCQLSHTVIVGLGELAKQINELVDAHVRPGLHSLALKQVRLHSLDF